MKKDNFVEFSEGALIRCSVVISVVISWLTAVNFTFDNDTCVVDVEEVISGSIVDRVIRVDFSISGNIEIVAGSGVNGI